MSRHASSFSVDGFHRRLLRGIQVDVEILDRVQFLPSPFLELISEDEERLDVLPSLQGNFGVELGNDDIVEPTVERGEMSGDEERGEVGYHFGEEFDGKRVDCRELEERRMNLSQLEYALKGRETREISYSLVCDRSMELSGRGKTRMRP